MIILLCATVRAALIDCDELSETIGDRIATTLQHELDTRMTSAIESGCLDATEVDRSELGRTLIFETVTETYVHQTLAGAVNASFASDTLLQFIDDYTDDLVLLMDTMDAIETMWYGMLNVHERDVSEDCIDRECLKSAFKDGVWGIRDTMVHSDYCYAEGAQGNCSVTATCDALGRCISAGAALFLVRTSGSSYAEQLEACQAEGGYPVVCTDEGSIYEWAPWTAWTNVTGQWIANTTDNFFQHHVDATVRWDTWLNGTHVPSPDDLTWYGCTPEGDVDCSLALDPRTSDVVVAGDCTTPRYTPCVLWSDHAATKIAKVALSDTEAEGDALAECPMGWTALYCSSEQNVLLPGVRFVRANDSVLLGLSVSEMIAHVPSAWWGCSDDGMYVANEPDHLETCVGWTSSSERHRGKLADGTRVPCDEPHPTLCVELQE